MYPETHAAVVQSTEHMPYLHCLQKHLHLCFGAPLNRNTFLRALRCVYTVTSPTVRVCLEQNPTNPQAPGEFKLTSLWAGWF